MYQLGPKEPVILEQANSVWVTIRRETLASPQTTIMEYLEAHPTIKNRQAREITHITEDYQIKNIFRDMVEAGMIEQVPGTRTSSTAYRKRVNGSEPGRNDKMN
jgi:ATP-dependent DNA helicase RecG